MLLLVIEMMTKHCMGHILLHPVRLHFCSSFSCVRRYCMQFELTEVRRSCTKASVGKSKNEVVSVAADWPSRLTKGAEVCVECQSLAMRRRLGGRCRGHGVLHKETRWVVVAAARTTGCHGKWTLKSRQDACQCSSESPLSFILV